MNARERLAGIETVLEDPRVRTAVFEGRRWYCPLDVIQIMGEMRPEIDWTELKRARPSLRSKSRRLPPVGGDGKTEPVEMLSLRDTLRLIQSLDTPRAERIKTWLAAAGQRVLEEIENPELAILRTARIYQRKGRNRPWIDKRLRGISARHELTAEWRRRGVTQSDEYRGLTNDLMRAAFGMDVNAYRGFKNLTRPGENLRDSMSDLELVLTMLAETAAASLHRYRASGSFEQLQRDVQEAGEITARTRSDIEQRTNRPVVTPGRFGPPPAPARPSQAEAPAAQPTSQTARTVA